MLKTSTGLRNYLLATGSFKTAMDGGFLKMYGGAVPATADAALGAAVPLNIITVDGDDVTGLSFAASAADGIIQKAAEAWEAHNIAGDYATFFRFVLTGDTGTNSTTEKRIQGTIGLVGTDMIMADNLLVNGAPQAVQFFSVALPA
jgi:hypothetical protein